MQVIELFDSTKLAGAAALYNVLSLKESAGSGYLQKKKLSSLRSPRHRSVSPITELHSAI